MKILLLVVLASLQTSLAACQSSSDPVSPDPPDHVVPKGARAFGIHVTEAATGGYDAAYQTARSTGMDMFPWGFLWSTIEPDEGSWDFTFFDIANLFFGPEGLPLYLAILGPINTNVVDAPADLVGLAWDDPEMIARYTGLLDSLYARTPALDIEVLVLGNEIDATLASEEDWAAYRALFVAARDRAKELWGSDLKVSATIMYDALRSGSSAVRTLVAEADIISVTYYPLNGDFTIRPPGVVGPDIDALVAAYPGVPIYFQEIGYQSSPVSNSSESQQAEFVSEAFAAWDRNSGRIPYMGWLWLTDLSQESTDELLGYYGLPDQRFAEYLRTLGLRRFDGSEKPAFGRLVEELGRRGW